MKKKALFSLVILMVLMSSCVYSLFPIYTKDTLTFLPALVGKWSNGGDEILFEPDGKYSYRMTAYEESEIVAVYEVHLVHVGGDIFMDLYPSDDDSFSGKGVPSFEKNLNANYFPVHSFSKLKLVDGKLQLISFDLNMMHDLFKSNRIRLRHENVEGTILITAQPKEIHKFLKQYSNDASVFDSPTEYVKID